MTVAVMRAQSLLVLCPLDRDETTASGIWPITNESLLRNNRHIVICQMNNEYFEEKSNWNCNFCCDTNRTTTHPTIMWQRTWFCFPRNPNPLYAIWQSGQMSQQFVFRYYLRRQRMWSTQNPCTSTQAARSKQLNHTFGGETCCRLRCLHYTVCFIEGWHRCT